MKQRDMTSEKDSNRSDKSKEQSVRRTRDPRFPSQAAHHADQVGVTYFHSSYDS